MQPPLHLAWLLLQERDEVGMFCLAVKSVSSDNGLGAEDLVAGGRDMKAQLSGWALNQKDMTLTVRQPRLES